MKAGFVLKWRAAIVLFALTFECAALYGQGITFATNSYTVSGEPNCLVAADVFASGKPDLISGNFGPLTVLANLGNGTFSSNASYNVGGGTYRVVAADVNGDGKMDLISVSSGTTRILTNNGSGTFVPSSTNNVGGNCAVAFSVNGSGKPDLIIGGNGIMVLTNNGSGHFGSNAMLDISGSVSALAAADINADGKTDLIAADFNSNSLLVFTNDGTGFGSNATYAVGNAPNSVAAADVNHDGQIDLIYANSSDNTLTVLTNDGSGFFAASATLHSGRGPYGVVVTDVNGDRTPDLIAIDNLDFQGALYIFTNSDSGTFGPCITINAGRELTALATADFNGDGKPDLAIGNSGVTITVMLNTTVFPPPPLSITSAGNQSLVYWTSPAPNSVLQATTNLNNPNWVTVTNGVPVLGMIVTNTSSNLFFRLISQ